VASESFGLRASSHIADYVQAAYAVDMDAVLRNASDLASYPSRVTGYEGCEEAVNYIASAFSSMGLTPFGDDGFYQKYKTVVPVDRGSSLRVADTVFQVMSLWPNLFDTSSGTCWGRLVYVGEDEGGLDKQLKGCIAVFEFNSGDLWKVAMLLGAKAAVFLFPESTNRRENEAKFDSAPVPFPRVLVREEDSEAVRRLAMTGAEASLTVNMTLQSTEGSNVLGMVEGGSLRNEFIVVTAFYDSWSAAPALAPGSDEALSVSLLLELARIVKQMNPARSVLFAALSGHYEGLAGAREFVERYYFGGQAIGPRIAALINLDISSDTDKLGVLYAGYFYTYYGVPVIDRYEWVRAAIEGYGSRIRTELGYWVESGITDPYWYSLVPSSYYLDSEPASIAGGIGITLMTVGGCELNRSLPYRTEPRREAVEPQANLAAAIISAFADDTSLEIPWDRLQPKRVYKLVYQGSGFTRLRGQVVEYDPTSGTYKPVPNALVQVSRVGATDALKKRDYDPWAQIIAIADENGSYAVNGIAAVTCSVGNYLVRAFKLNESTGAFLYGPDNGPYGSQTWNPTTFADSDPVYITPVAFRSAAWIVPGVIDVKTMNPILLTDRVTGTLLELHDVYVDVLDAATHGPPLSYGAQVYSEAGVVVAFAPLGIEPELIFRAGPERKVIAVIRGGAVPPGLADRAVEAIARSVFNLADERVTLQESNGLRDQVATDALAKARDYLSQVDRTGVGALYDAYLAWRWGYVAYSEATATVFDAISSIVFFASIAIPFSILVERLILGKGDLKKRILFVAGVSVVVLSYLYMLQPGFRMATNVIVVVHGFLVLLLTLPVVAIILRDLYGYVEDIRRSATGVHFARISRSGALTAAFTVGIENMKKRRGRSLLVLFSVAMIMFAVTSLASAIPTLYVRPSQVEGEAAYDGILARRFMWASLSDLTVNLVRAIAPGDAKISVRYWVYPPGLPPATEVLGPTGKATVSALASVDPSEGWLATALLSGESPASPNELWCLLPQSLASKMGAGVGSEIIVMGVKLSVIGLVNDSAFEHMRDLDQAPMVPLDPMTVTSLGVGEAEVNPSEGRLPVATVMLTSVSVSRLLGGNPRIVSVVMSNPKPTATATALSGLEADIFSGDSSGITVYRRAMSYVLSGWGFLAVPVVIGALTVLSSVLGAVYERTREIGIYSAVGLAPLHIIGIFIAEMTVYAVLSAVIGYALSLSVAQVFAGIGWIQPNMASTSIALSTALIMITTLAATAYPAVKASQLAAPSIERKWKPTTLPTGDGWELPLPYVASIDEVKSIMNFIEEFLETHMTDRAEPFSVSELRLGGDDKRLLISLTVRLKPYELGIGQAVEISALREGDSYTFSVMMKRKTGMLSAWRSGAYDFTNELRKQFLLWRTLREEERRKYTGR